MIIPIYIYDIILIHVTECSTIVFTEYICIRTLLLSILTWWQRQERTWLQEKGPGATVDKWRLETQHSEVEAKLGDGVKAEDTNASTSHEDHDEGQD